VFQALIHFVAGLPDWLLGAIQWTWVHYFHHDWVILGAFVVAVLALVSMIVLLVRGPRWRR
jgi:uncharacterized membrane protein YcjF (UPF0283 family)